MLKLKFFSILGKKVGQKDDRIRTAALKKIVVLANNFVLQETPR